MSAPLGELRRILGPLAGIAVCIGMAIGAGILRTPGEVALQLPSAPWILAVWCLGALVATLDALILAEMAASVPRVGGLVAYVRLSFGPAAAFLVGWSMLLVTWPASLAGVAVATSELLLGGAEALGTGGAATPQGHAVAAAVIVVVGGLNLLGLRFGARLEVALLVLKVTLLAGICIAAVVAAPAAPAATAPPAPMPSTPKLWLAAIGAAMTKVIFSYDGYADAVYLAGETRDPGRALPRALLTSLLTITGLYLLANATFLTVLGVDGLAHSTFAALDVARAAFGEFGGQLLTVIALVLLLSAVNAYFLTGPRIARLLAEERLAVPGLGRVGESGAPVLATLWIVAAACCFALTNTFNELLDVVVPIIAATTAMVAAGLLVQRARAPERPRPFRTPCAGLVVSLQLVIGAALLVSFLANNAEALAVDAAALLVGLLIYWWVRRRAGPVPS